MDKVMELDGEPEVILIPGDFVAHHVAASKWNPGNFTLLKETIVEVTNRIHTKFPGSLILPTLGNNDVRNHYIPPTAANKTEYYSFLFNTWFEIQKDHPVIKANYGTLNETML